MAATPVVEAMVLGEVAVRVGQEDLVDLKGPADLEEWAGKAGPKVEARYS